MDTVDKQTRSRIMSRIRSVDTRPEMIARKALFACGFRYRLYVGKLPGHPDIVLKRHRKAVFIHGCFWHGHAGCPHFRMPTSNREFWAAKIARNQERDARSRTQLLALGWRVVILWECFLKKAEGEALKARLRAAIASDDPVVELAAADLAPDEIRRPKRRTKAEKGGAKDPAPAPTGP